MPGRSGESIAFIDMLDAVSEVADLSCLLCLTRSLIVRRSKILSHRLQLFEAERKSNDELTGY
jgi:hypothetical protein